MARQCYSANPSLQGKVCVTASPGAIALESREVFASNRANGHVSLTLAATTSGTRRMRTREEGSLRVRFPGACAGAPEAVLVNTAGGGAAGRPLRGRPLTLS